VDDARLVERVEAGGDALRHPHRGVGRQRAALLEHVLERRALDVADREVVAAVGLARLEDRDEVLVLHLGGGARLLVEALLEGVVVGELELQELERHDLAVVADGLEDEPHPALAEERLEPVAAERLTDLDLTGL
jgi:hypothetical protein